jgi:hypothetical protein
MAMGKLAFLALAVFVTIGCASGHCRGRKEDPNKKVFIYKSDGSKQCAQASAISVEQMAAELKDIKIYSKEKRSDGRMHPMVCGGSTGKINVYEISESDLPAAKLLLFDVLDDARGPKK